MIATESLLVTVDGLSVDALAALRRSFTSVHVYPRGYIPQHILAEVEMWFASWTGPVDGVSASQMPRLHTMQLNSAGVNQALASPFWESSAARERIRLCSASGIHCYCIPQFVVAQIINLYMNLHTQILLSKSNHKWPSRDELRWNLKDKSVRPRSVTGGPRDAGLTAEGPLAFATIRGRTVGMLGYGSIGRETARILSAMGCRIVVANSQGMKTEDDGASSELIPGSGDKDGVLPDEWYSARDPKSFRHFLAQSDIIVASLPSTPNTRNLLNASNLLFCKSGSILVNVGRGDLISSDDLLQALDGPNGLYAAALDVTNPEPLPDEHPLWAHPRTIITPHTSGNFEGYLDTTVELLLKNVERIRHGLGPFNVVNFAEGY